MDRLPPSDEAAWCDEIDRPNNSHSSSDGYLDLCRWDYLTQKYDRADFFQENESLRHDQEQCALREASRLQSGADVASSEDSHAHSACTGDSAGVSHYPRHVDEKSAMCNADDKSLGQVVSQKKRAFRSVSQSHSTEYETGYQMQMQQQRQQQILDAQRLGTSHSSTIERVDETLETNFSQTNLSRYLHKPPHEKGSFDSSSGMDQLYHPPSESAPNASFHLGNDMISPPRVAELLKLPMHASPDRGSHGVAKASLGLLPTRDGSAVQGSGGGLQLQQTSFAFQSNPTTIRTIPTTTEDGTQAPHLPLVANTGATVLRHSPPVTARHYMYPQHPVAMPPQPPALPWQPNDGAPMVAAAAAAATATAPIIPPLTAYNYFYRNERDTIINGMRCTTDPIPPCDFDFTSRKMEQLLHQHWTVDPFKKKRQHKKTHGFIDFQTLSREIAKRWKRLPEHGRAFYRHVAHVDQERYESYLATMRQSASNGTAPAGRTPAT